MRLDLFLKTSRLIKRRTVAKLACDSGKILVNGKVSKASYEVQIDDIIELQIKNPSIKAKVKLLGKPRNKSDSENMFILI